MSPSVGNVRLYPINAWARPQVYPRVKLAYLFCLHKIVKSSYKGLIVLVNKVPADEVRPYSGKQGNSDLVNTRQQRRQDGQTPCLP